MARTRKDILKKKKTFQDRSGNVSAIFVHAGAGFHSITNEYSHLEACNRSVLTLVLIGSALFSIIDKLTDFF